VQELCRDLELCHDRVIAYLRQFELTGAVPPTESRAPTAMTTAEVLSAIQETKAEELARLKQAALSRVVEWQREDGSWTDPNSNNPWDTSSTAWAARALLREPDPRARLAAERGLAWLANSALPSGGLPTNRNCATANTYATAYTLRALAAAEGAPVPQVPASGGRREPGYGGGRSECAGGRAGSGGAGAWVATTTGRPGSKPHEGFF
jgi:hypothetical protein